MSVASLNQRSIDKSDSYPHVGYASAAKNAGKATISVFEDISNSTQMKFRKLVDGARVVGKDDILMTAGMLGGIGLWKVGLDVIKRYYLARSLAWEGKYEYAAGMLVNLSKDLRKRGFIKEAGNMIMDAVDIMKKEGLKLGYPDYRVTYNAINSVLSLYAHRDASPTPPVDKRKMWDQLFRDDPLLAKELIEKASESEFAAAEALHQKGDYTTSIDRSVSAIEKALYPLKLRTVQPPEAVPAEAVSKAFLDLAAKLVQEKGKYVPMGLLGINKRILEVDSSSYNTLEKFFRAVGVLLPEWHVDDVKKENSGDLKVTVKELAELAGLRDAPELLAEEIKDKTALPTEPIVKKTGGSIEVVRFAELTESLRPFGFTGTDLESLREFVVKRLGEGVVDEVRSLVMDMHDKRLLPEGATAEDMVVVVRALVKVVEEMRADANMKALPGSGTSGAYGDLIIKRVLQEIESEKTAKEAVKAHFAGVAGEEKGEPGRTGKKGGQNCSFDPAKIGKK